MIHSVGHYSDECKVLGGFGTTYAASQITKDCGSNPVPRKIFQKNAIINNVVGEIQMIEPKKVSAVNHEAPECLKSDFDENNLCQVENMSIDKTK